MKKIFAIVFFTLSTLSVKAQELTWFTDMTLATDASIKENKPLLLFFTGSDWCGWCIKLQNEVFKTEDFKKWASENVILVELDFPRRKVQEDKIKLQNFELQKTLQVRGYPTIWFVNPSKTEENKINLTALGSTGYVYGGASKWIEVANGILKK